MREIEEREINSHKCNMCGSRNKLYEKLSYRGVMYGYRLRCCNCGKVMNFFNPDKNPEKIKYFLKVTERKCFMHHECRNYHCEFNPHYNEYKNKPFTPNGIKDSVELTIKEINDPKYL